MRLAFIRAHALVCACARIYVHMVVFYISYTCTVMEMRLFRGRGGGFGFVGGGAHVCTQ